MALEGKVQHFQQESCKHEVGNNAVNVTKIKTFSSPSVKN